MVQFLDQTIAWYHQLGAQQQLVSDANDDVYVSADRQMANEVVRLAFQFARTQAEGAQPTAASAQQSSGQAASGQGAAPSTYQTLMQQEAEAQKDENQVVGEVDDLQKKIATASGKQKQALEAQLAETQAEVDLAKARVDAIRNMARFLSGASTGATGLSAQIDALESTLPPDLREATRSGSANGSSSGGTSAPSSQQQAAPATPPAAIANVAAGSGLWESATSLFSTWGKLRSINTAVQQTQELARSAQDIRNPLVADLRELTQRGDELAHQADTANTATLEQERQQLDAVTQQFKQLTGSAIPLAQAGILLGLYQKNLANWHASVVSEFWTQSRGFAARLIFLGVIIALVLGASELWRRAIYKYVRDTRRRWQLHWVRKFVVWGAIATIVTFSLVSQIGSMATFAGLITAGVAVSLQNVIQSIMGYFFLIGKYGIRAGDRVMIGGVSGEVIDVGSGAHSSDGDGRRGRGHAHRPRRGVLEFHRLSGDAGPLQTDSRHEFCMARDHFDAARRHEFLDRPRAADEGCRGRPRRFQGRNRQATLGHRRCFRRQSWDGPTAHCATPVHFVGTGGAGALPRSVAPSDGNRRAGNARHPH